MSNEAVELQDAHHDAGHHIDRWIPPISDLDSSPFIQINGVAGDHADLSGGWAPPQILPQILQSAPSTFLSRSAPDDDDSLSRYMADYGARLTSLHDALSRSLRRYNELALSRQEVLLLRSRVQYDWTRCVDQRRFVSESHEAFMHEATSIYRALDSDHSTVMLGKLLTQADNDYKRHEELLLETRGVEKQLSEAEYALQGKETQMAQAAQRSIDLLSQFELPNPGQYQPSIAPSEEREKEVPFLVQNYFDKAGDVRLERERIMDLEVEHRQERARRILLEDQEQALDISEEEFEDDFNKQISEAETALQEAFRKSETAKQCCLDDGLDPELYRFNKGSSGAASSRSPSEPKEENAPGTPLAVITSQTVPPSLNPLFDVIPYGQLFNNEGIPAISEAYQASAPPSVLSQALSTNQQRKTSTPLGDRILGWMDEFPVKEASANETLAKDASTQTLSLSRSKSSESYSSPILEKREDGTIGVNRVASYSLRKQQRGPVLTSALNSETKTARARRSFPNSQPITGINTPWFRPWEFSYEDALDNLRRLSGSES